MDERDTEMLLGATVGAAVAALVLGCAYWAVLWLAGMPPLFWRRCVAGAVLLVGCGAVAGALARLERR